MAQTITESVRTGEFLISEANGFRSRDQVVVAAGSGILIAGRVLAKLMATGEYVPYDNDGTDGSETAAAVLYAKVDATAAVRAVVIARDAEVNGHIIGWGAVDAADITAGVADLAAAGILVRS